MSNKENWGKKKQFHGLFLKVKLEDPNTSNLEYLSFHLQIKIIMSQEEESWNYNATLKCILLEKQNSNCVLAPLLFLSYCFHAKQSMG